MSGAENMLRLFVAIHAPEDIRTRIQEAQDSLRRAVPQARVSWARREQFHLTIRFLGAVAADRVPSLIGALENGCRGIMPLELRAAGVGFFPNARRPRVVWVGVRETLDRLRALHQAVQEVSMQFSSEEPETHFSGHITLARIKEIGRAETESLDRAAKGLSLTIFGEWTADHIHLMRSELSPKGSRHTSLAAIVLGSRNLTNR